MTAAPDEGWLRLDPRNRYVAAIFLAGPPVVVGGLWLLGLPSGPLWTAFSLGVTGMVIGGISVKDWVTIRYRVTDERLQVRRGWLVRTHTSIPRERIRSVDITASPLYRIFQLVSVKIGTGQHAGAGHEEIKLEGVSPSEAERLRAVLLYRRATPRPVADSAAVRPEPAEAAERSVRTEPAEPGVPGPAEPSVRSEPADLSVRTEPASRNLATLDWSWIRFGPLTTSSLLAVFGALGVLYKPLDAMGVDPPDLIRLGVVRDAVGEFRSVPLWLSITVVVLVLAIVAVVGALLLFALAWSGYRLDDDGDTLRTRRGLLTTRSVTLEKRRLRGVEIAEPLLLRAGRGARLNVVAVGLDSGHGGRGPNRDKDRNVRALLPPAPRTEAHRVATAVLGEDPTTGVALRPHPRKALRRRINRALLAALAVAAILAVLAVWWLPAWTWLCALALIPALLPFSYDAYRSLGHGIAGRYLVTRSGTGIRRTAGLRRDGVIGWTLTRSPFQRRAGLVTLTATTAANDGAYKIRDLDPATALNFAEEAVPGLLAPFLVTPVRSTDSGGRNPRTRIR